MKILNLYAGIGGNRKLWGNEHQITAVEINEEILNVYHENFPFDKAILGDAEEYLLKHFNEFDFIWDSTPCQKNSRARFWGHGKKSPAFPDLNVYKHYIFLQHYFKGRFVVENVVPYYEPLIKPTIKIGRHLFWSNFDISHFESTDADIKNGNIKEWEQLHGFDLSCYKFSTRKDQILRNCVHPDLGLHILKESQRQGLFNLNEIS